jgi:peptidyl-prolyl cis-trans isomerase B (cyclophilin B)
MKQFFFTLIIGTLLLSSCTEKDYLVTIHTELGDMKVVLYDETPGHKENFLKLAESGKYDSVIWHRVIKGFMAQGGDLNTRPNAEKEENYTIPAEIVPGLWHKKGALAAARMGDAQNPEKRSSGTQFYIVQGVTYNEAQLEQYLNGRYIGNRNTRLQTFLKEPENKAVYDTLLSMMQSERMEEYEALIESLVPQLEAKDGPIKRYTLTDEQRKLYTTVGGTPHLDNDYTVFGEVVDGLDVIDALCGVATNPGDRPVEDVHMSMTVEKVSKKTLETEYGYKGGQ